MCFVSMKYSNQIIPMHWQLTNRIKIKMRKIEKVERLRKKKKEFVNIVTSVSFYRIRRDNFCSMHQHEFVSLKLNSFWIRKKNQISTKQKIYLQEQCNCCDDANEMKTFFEFNRSRILTAGIDYKPPTDGKLQRTKNLSGNFVQFHIYHDSSENGNTRIST